MNTYTVTLKTQAPDGTGPANRNTAAIKAETETEAKSQALGMFTIAIGGQVTTVESVIKED